MAPSGTEAVRERVANVYAQAVALPPGARVLLALLCIFTAALAAVRMLGSSLVYDATALVLVVGASWRFPWYVCGTHAGCLLRRRLRPRRGLRCVACTDPVRALCRSFTRCRTIPRDTVGHAGDAAVQRCSHRLVKCGDMVPWPHAGPPLAQ